MSAGALAVVMGATASPALAYHDSGPPVRVIAEGLDGPREIQFGPGGLYVAESDTGEVSRVGRRGHVHTVADGLPGVQGVEVVGKTLLSLLGGPPPPGEEGGPGGGEGYEPTSLLAAPLWRPTEQRVVATLLEHELAENPDGQEQFGPDGMPTDALSNPFYLLEHRKGVLVADGGGNDVLLVKPNGTVSTFFVPPTVDTGGCADVENNGGATGCDSVPTGLAYGPDGSIYVSALTGEVPGEGRVYKIHPRTGALLDTISGFFAPTGVAVGGDGSIYVSELFHNAPPPDAPPPADFDPASIGQVVKVAPDGTRTYAAVTQPTGLLWDHGKLYASAWSVGAFFEMPGAGQIVEVSQRAFQANPSV